MRAISLTALFFTLSCGTGAYGQDASLFAGMQRQDHLAGAYHRSASANPDIFGFDILQRTCALYFAMRSGAFESPVEFGRSIDDTIVHWNKCPGGTMVACVKVPEVNGDTTITGIPWTY